MNNVNGNIFGSSPAQFFERHMEFAFESATQSKPLVVTVGSVFVSWVATASTSTMLAILFFDTLRAATP